MRHVMKEVRAFVANKCRCRNYNMKKEWLFLTRKRELSNFAKENELQTKSKRLENMKNMKKFIIGIIIAVELAFTIDVLFLNEEHSITENWASSVAKFRIGSGDADFLLMDDDSIDFLDDCMTVIQDLNDSDLEMLPHEYRI